MNTATSSSTCSNSNTTVKDEQQPGLPQEPSAKKQKCACDGSLLCCPLARDAKDFILYVLRTQSTPNNCWKNKDSSTNDNDDDNDQHHLVDYLSDLWMEDRDIANLALQSNTIRADELPAVLQNDRDYLLQAVQQNSEVWHSLPEPYRADPEFVVSIPCFADLLVLHDVFGQYPAMVHEREIWVHALDTVLLLSNPGSNNHHQDNDNDNDTTTMVGRQEENKELYRQLLHDFAPDSIRSDAEIMRRSSTFIPNIYSYFGSELREDKDFFQNIYAGGAKK